MTSKGTTLINTWPFSPKYSVAIQFPIENGAEVFLRISKSPKSRRFCVEGIAKSTQQTERPESTDLEVRTPKIDRKILFFSEIGDVFVKLDEDKDCRVIILDGEGKSFCAGIDLNGKLV